VSSDQTKHVFISYAHEDNDDVDRLCRVLEAAGIPYWRDRNDLGPGDAWKAKIRSAIRDGALVFLACFSDQSRAKDKSHMNEELTLAIEEYRKIPPGRTWLIPVRFDDGALPEWDLGAGRVLGDVNYTDLFDDAYTPQAVSLVTAIHNLMGEKQLSSSAAQEVVEHATNEDRVPLLTRMTKEMLLDPTRRIELDDLVTQEVERILQAVNDPSWVNGPDSGDEMAFSLRAAEKAQDLLELSLPFCASVYVAARWGSPENLSPWADGVKALVEAAHKSRGGYAALLNLRFVPGLAVVMTAALAGVSNRQWGNLKALVVDATVRERNYPKPLALLETIDGYRPFSGSELASNIVSRSSTTGRSLEETMRELQQFDAQVLLAPVADWLFASLRPVFIDQMRDEDTYAAAFDRAEIFLGALAQDAVNERLERNPGGWGESNWFGRAIWRARRSHTNPAREIREEAEAAAASWGPLHGSLFGGRTDRASAALNGYEDAFARTLRNTR